jgi:hypothetical protein
MIAAATGSARVVAATPAAPTPTRTRRISSVA